MPDETLLTPTPLLEVNAPPISALIAARGWRALPQTGRIAAIHAFVRDEIAFGYNANDAVPASRVLAEGRGQCNTKAILLMALLRGAGVPCRLHGFTIHKQLQRGVVPELVYPLAPERILHSWVEAWTGARWQVLEGFIIDRPMLRTLQDAFPGRTALCAFGVGTAMLHSPPIEAAEGDTLIQSTGIVEDLGVFDTPDDFYSRHAQRFGMLRAGVYRYVVRHWMNARVAAIRAGRVPPVPILDNTAFAPDQGSNARIVQHTGDSSNEERKRCTS